MRRILKFNEIIFLTLFFATGNFYLHAQKPLTLKECINYSFSNNRNIKIANYNVDISQKNITEQVGNYLPQINAQARWMIT